MHLLKEEKKLFSFFFSSYHLLCRTVVILYMKPYTDIAGVGL